MKKKYTFCGKYAFYGNWQHIDLPVKDDRKDEDKDEADHEQDETSPGSYPLEPPGLGEGGLFDSSDGILLQEGGFGSKLRSGPLFVFLKDEKLL